MAVVQKIKSGDDQPKGGRAITGVAGARGLAAADVVDSNHALEPDGWRQSITAYTSLAILASSKVDQPIADINGKLDARLDDRNYAGLAE